MDNFDRDPNLERIRNLLKFTFLLSTRVTSDDLRLKSPDYILEKYTRYIGFPPIVTDDLMGWDEADFKMFLSEYRKRWGNGTDSVMPQLKYLFLSNNFGFDRLVCNFERFLGPVDSINPNPEGGLHSNMRDYLESYMESDYQKNLILTCLRDLKLGNLVG